MTEAAPSPLTPHDIRNMPETEQPAWFGEAELDGVDYAGYVIDTLEERFGVTLSTEAKDMIHLSAMGRATEIACQTYNAVIAAGE
jgi:hypothetical protein